MTEWLFLFGVAWCVYSFDATWWVGPETIVLTGDQPEHFKARIGPHLKIKGDSGLFFPGLLPPFAAHFELGGTRTTTKEESAERVLVVARQATCEAAILHRLGAGLWVWLFIASPFLVSMVGLIRVWWLVLLGLFALTVTIVIQFAISTRRLMVDTGTPWIADSVVMLLSPPAAISAGHRLTRIALRPYSAITVGGALAGDVEFVQLARLFHFAPGLLGSHEGDSAEIQARLAFLLQRRGLRSAFEAAPKQESPEMVGFCPRCQLQLLRWDGNCPDCLAVPLVSFENGMQSSARSEATVENRRH